MHVECMYANMKIAKKCLNYNFLLVRVKRTNKWTNSTHTNNTKCNLMIVTI